MSGAERLSEIADVIDELKDDDVEVRVAATRQLSRIADALGPRRVREELVPYLTESTDEGDEVLVAMVEELSKLVEYVGRGYVYVLLEPAEALASVEEGAVREKAVRATLEIVGSMPPQQINEYFVPMVRRLSTHDWFTGRMSACGLFAKALEKNEEMPGASRAQLGALFSRLCRDDTPMVRRMAAQSLAAVVAADSDLEDDEETAADEARERYLSLFSSLADDDQDSVRLQTVENCIALARRRDSFAADNDVLPVVLATAADRSWRVRWSAATAFARICRALVDALSSSSPSRLPPLRDALSAAFVELLNDVEPEVRVATAVAVADVADGLVAKDDVLDDTKLLLPSVKALASDSSHQVRAALASGVASLCSTSRSEARRRARGERGGASSANVDEDDDEDAVLNVILGLLRDESSQVRLNVISNLANAENVSGGQKYLVPALVDLARDSKWRVRAAAIKHVPVVAAKLGKNDALYVGCVEWLADDVAAVRELATANLRNLAKIFGTKWTRNVALPKILDMCTHTYYLRRVTAVKACAALAHLVPTQAAAQLVLPALLHAAAEDPVPNVRFNAANSLHTLANALLRIPFAEDEDDDDENLSLGSAAMNDDDDNDDEEDEPMMDTTDDAHSDLVYQHIVPVLDRLAREDPDADVRDFAAKARDTIINARPTPQFE